MKVMKTYSLWAIMVLWILYSKINFEVLYLLPKGPKRFLKILGSLLQIEFLFLLFEIFTQHFLEE